MEGPELPVQSRSAGREIARSSYSVAAAASREGFLRLMSGALMRRWLLEGYADRMLRTRRAESLRAISGFAGRGPLRGTRTGSSGPSTEGRDAVRQAASMKTCGPAGVGWSDRPTSERRVERQRKNSPAAVLSGGGADSPLAHG